MPEKPVVVVTGSDGLIGEAVIRQLHHKYELVGIDNDKTSDLDEFHDLIYCDLTEDEQVRQALVKLEERHGRDIASVVHLAAYYDFSGKASPMYEKLTVEGTGRLLEQLQRLNVEQFQFSSTLLVMKPTEDEDPLQETDPKQAEWAYPQSKLKTEKLIADKRGDIPAVVLRIGGVYDDYGRAVPLVQQTSRIYEKQLESYVFPGDPSRGQTMVHLDDVVAAIDLAIEKRHDLSGFETFLIGEPEIMSYETLQDRLGEMIHGKEWPTIRVPKTVAKAGARVMSEFSDDDGDFIQPWMIDIADDDYRVSIERAQERLGWEPKHHLRDTLPHMVGHLLEDPATWYRNNGLEPPAQARSK